MVTGASYGLGEEFARQLARRGYDLLLTARSTELLEAVRAGIQAERPGCDVRILPLDLGRYGAPQKLSLWAREQEEGPQGGPVTLLVNNAGFGALGTFDNISLARQRKMVDLNVAAVVELTHLFLAPMKARRQGAIVNLSSTAAFFPVPYFSVYAATKAFVLAFSSALYEEARPFGVHVMAVCPGPTATRFMENAHGTAQQKSVFRAMRLDTAPHVVAAALRALDHGRPWVVPGKMDRLSIFLSRLVPRQTVLYLAARLFRRAGT